MAIQIDLSIHTTKNYKVTDQSSDTHFPHLLFLGKFANE